MTCRRGDSSMMRLCQHHWPPGDNAMTRRQAAIPFILVTILIDVLGIGLIVPILPELIVEMTGGEISQGSSAYGIFIAVYAAMQFLFAPILGALSDRFGRRPVLLVSLLGAGLDYLLMALAPKIGRASC